MPTDDTKKLPTPDCNFHEWSWEAFVWATAMDQSGMPRFLSLPTPDDLLKPGFMASVKAKPRLQLSSRSALAHAPTGAGAIVEADGNMLVGPNGYPVYASVHMNSSYVQTAQKNMIANGGYNSQPANDYFKLGAGVIKATWLRLDKGEAPPAGAFTIEADVPKLTVVSGKAVPSGDFETVTVALVGMHVVGYTANHPEFLWATFEYNRNAPMTADNTFSQNGVSSQGYVFYKAGTPYSQVNLQNSSPATLTFDQSTGKFSPVTNAVQENRTGGEDQPGGPANIASLNRSAQGFLKSAGPMSVFANYDLIGTVWMMPNTYVPTNKNSLNLGRKDAVGSVNLANTTAETFVQSSSNKSKSDWQNCFMCHNAQSYTYSPSSGVPALKARLIANSHMIAEKSPYAVPNVMPLKTVEGQPVTCSVFDDGYQNQSPQSDALYVPKAGQVCKPDGSASGLCKKWFGRCQVSGTGEAVTFKVFNDGYTSPTSSSDAIYFSGKWSACKPDGSSKGTCRKWTGLATTASGKNVACYLFNDGYTSTIGPTNAIFSDGKGNVCMPNGQASGECRKWFGRCFTQ